MTFTLIICKSLDEASQRPYFLLERYPCSEGWRTRVCGETFKTQAEAEAYKASILEEKN